MKHTGEGLGYYTSDPIKPHNEYDLFSSIFMIYCLQDIYYFST